MNTNQLSEQATEDAASGSGANPFASAILQNFFNKKPAMINETISENAPQPKAEASENANTVSQILTRLESKVEQAAVNLGIGAEEVETMPFDLSQLETEGYLSEH